MGNGNPNWVKGISQNPAGRPKGQDAFNRAAVIKLLKSRSFDPVASMLDLYNDPKSSNYLRLDILKELCSFLIPHVKTLQLIDDDGNPPSITIKWQTDPPALNAEQHREASGQFSDGMTDAVAQVVDAITDDDDDER